MRKIVLMFFAVSIQISGQELFVISEPASNMPTGSIGVRVANSIMKESQDTGYNNHLMPEIMWGINKDWMIHSSAFVSNRNQNMVVEGGGLYAKNRFLSIDDFHSHFRMAAFGQYSFNNADMHQEEINLMGHNSGVQIGLIATQLIHKVAISTNFSYIKAFVNSSNNPFPKNQNDSALNCTLSFGKLMYPKKYNTFNETNINLMLELKGQKLQGNSKSFLDIVPSIQFIFNSQARLDFAYIKQLHSTLNRTAPNGIYLKFEYTFFNVTN